MHLHIRRPSAASLVTLATCLATLTLMSCGRWTIAERYHRAAQAIEAGQGVAALAMLLPPPFDLIAAGSVLVGGHVTATCLRRGPAPPAKGRPRKT